jgi:hypothetical protein
MENSRRWPVAAGIATFVAVILVVVASLWGTTLPAAHSNTNTGSGSVAFHPGFDKTPADALCTTNHYNGISTQTPKPGDPNARQFATAISNPFKGTTDAAVNKEIVLENCGNPTFLKMSLDEMTLWKGIVPGADENMAWIEKIQQDIAKHTLDSFSGTMGSDSLKVTSVQYQKYAGWVNTVWLRFNDEGLQSPTSTRNWELPATVTPGIQPVAVQATVQESKPAWVRTLRDKVGTCLYRVGFNAEDKRIEVFPCATPPTPGTPPTGHPTPKPTPTPTPSPSCTSMCPKNPKDSVTKPQGTVPLGPDPVQTTAPTPKPTPLDPTTPVTKDPGPSVPVQGATPAPVTTTKPTTPTQSAPPTDPGTPVTDAG